MHFQEMMEAELNKGIEQGIEAFILDKFEDNVPHETIVQKLVKRFGITQEKAKEYLNRYI